MYLEGCSIYHLKLLTFMKNRSRVTIRLRFIHKKLINISFKAAHICWVIWKVCGETIKEFSLIPKKRIRFSLLPKKNPPLLQNKNVYSSTPTQLDNVITTCYKEVLNWHKRWYINNYMNSIFLLLFSASFKQINTIECTLYGA